MKVWIVMRLDHEDTKIVGVFLDPRPAETLRADGEREWRGYGWIVEEHEIQNPPLLVNA